MVKDKVWGSKVSESAMMRRSWDGWRASETGKGNFPGGASERTDASRREKARMVSLRSVT